MKPDRIREIIEEKVKEISKHCEQIGADFDKDAIHKFRVAVKTLRSFLRLLRSGSEEPYAKLPGKFKRLYQISGAIRDAQLELEKLEEHNTALPVYLTKLNSDIERHKQEWQLHYSKKLMQKLKKRLTSYDIVVLHPEVLASYFNSHIADIAKASSAKSPSNAQIHEMRKQLKDLVYASKLAKKEWKSAYEKIQVMPLKQLDRLTAEIGEYNDARLTFEHLNSFSSQKIDPGELVTIKKISVKESIKLKTQKKSVLSDIQNIINPLLPKPNLSL